VLTLAVRQAATTTPASQLRAASLPAPSSIQAIGIIMAHERCTQAQAFAILRGASQNSSLKLRDIAGRIVTSDNGRTPQPPSFDDS
jgi:hypothetical protein